MDMGIFDSENSPALQDMLSKLGAAVLPVVLSEIFGTGGQGGLSAIVAKLQQAGFGDQVKSWIGDGRNIPIDQVTEVLAHELPLAVDNASPDGKLPHTA